eukprot:10712562-Lingulodinium_polyedra.AAC.1
MPLNARCDAPTMFGGRTHAPRPRARARTHRKLANARRTLPHARARTACEPPRRRNHTRRRA